MRYVLVSVINPQRFFKSTCEHSSQKIWINDKAAFCCGPDKLYGKITGNKTRKKKISREYNRSYWRKEKKTDGLQSCRQSYEFESVRNDFNKIDRYCASHECRRKSGEFFNYKTHLDVTYKTRVIEQATKNVVSIKRWSMGVGQRCALQLYLYQPVPYPHDTSFTVPYILLELSRSGKDLGSVGWSDNPNWRSMFDRWTLTFETGTKKHSTCMW